MTKPQVTIYTVPECGISEQIKELLAKKGIPYKVVDLTGNKCKSKCEYTLQHIAAQWQK